MKKRIFGVMVSFVILCLANMAQATFVEFASAINQANGHSYYIYYSPTNPENPEWPFLNWNHANDITWFEAKTAAETMGGYLATITSEAEENFLQSTSAFAGSEVLEGIRAWIGLSDAEVEGTFKWVTGPESGQTLSYSGGWMDGEPNNTAPGENYVEWRNRPFGPYDPRAWNDVPHNAVGVNTFMVEFNPVPEPTTMLLFGTGIAGLAAVGRRRKK